MGRDQEGIWCKLETIDEGAFEIEQHHNAFCEENWRMGIH